MDPIGKRRERLAGMIRSRHRSGVPARRGAGYSRADIVRLYRRDLVVSRRGLEPSESFRSHATALRKYRARLAPRRVNPWDRLISQAGRLSALDRASVVRQPARTIPVRISKARACLRTSIFVHRSDARTNSRADATASRHCISVSLARLAPRSMRALQRRRQRQLMKSVSSFRTSCSQVACVVQVETRHYRPQPLLQIWS
jgi:hypothetical protein